MRNRPLLRGLLALSSPLLILMSLLVLLQRRGVDRLPALPALLIGTGLLGTSLLGWRRSRRNLLASLVQDGPQ